VIPFGFTDSSSHAGRFVVDSSLLREILAPPGQLYLEFCRKYLLEGSELVDPFAPEVPAERLLAACVDRQQIGKELPQATSGQQGGGHRGGPPVITMVLAPRGRGKTTLMRKAALEIPAHDLLVVPISLGRAVGRFHLAESGAQGAEKRLLSAILRSTFDRFWEVLRDPQRRILFLKGRRANREWMIRLQRLYRQVPSPQPAPPGSEPEASSPEEPAPAPASDSPTVRL